MRIARIAIARHLLFRVWGLVASRSIDGGRVHAKALASIYATLASDRGRRGAGTGSRGP